MLSYFIAGVALGLTGGEGGFGHLTSDGGFAPEGLVKVLPGW